MIPVPPVTVRAISTSRALTVPRDDRGGEERPRFSRSREDRPKFDRPRERPAGRTDWQEHPRSEAGDDRPRRENEDDSKIFAKRPAFGGRGAYRERTA